MALAAKRPAEEMKKLDAVYIILPLSLQGERTKDCPVMIIDDSLYENEETFYVTLLSHLGSKINHERNTSAVIIAPDSKDGKVDVTIRFAEFGMLSLLFTYGG